MLKQLLLLLLAICLLQQTVFGQNQLHAGFSYSPNIVYPGEEVTWSLYVWYEESGSTHRGIATLSCNVIYSDITDSLDDRAMLTANELEFEGSTYNVANHFNLMGKGEYHAPGEIRSLFVTQFPFNKLFDIGEYTPGAQGAIKPLFASGKFIATTQGQHNMNIDVNTALYWPDVTSSATSFDLENNLIIDASKTFTVLSPADFSRDGEVDVTDLLAFASQWLHTYTNPEDKLSADLASDEDDIVNLKDFAVFMQDWLK